MLKISARIAFIFLAFVAICMIQKPMFMALYAPLLSEASASELWRAVWHGIPMDCSIAGYLTVIPAICSIVAVAMPQRSGAVGAVMRVYLGLASVVLALIFVADLALYGYWGFRLDTTPIFYFTTSPSAALASAPWWQTLLGLVGAAVLALLIFILLRWVVRLTPLSPLRPRQRRDALIAGCILTLLLFIPIRGGVTVSTMNLSTAYFSSNQRLNHAAINPAFSLLYSATHQQDFASQYQEFTPERAEQLFAELAPVSLAADSLRPDTALLRVDRPDICLVILESFSSHLLPSLGGDSIAMRLDSIAREGLLYSRCYASSFRTDRALPAILSGWPGQPSTSIMKFARKIESIPSWPRRLAQDGGYELNYVYGGDINFTNMLAYLKSSGFERIVRDADFSLLQRASKWGAHDDAVFTRALSDMRERAASAAPQLTVIQTSSSHEPFEVPYSNPAMPSVQANAFAFADSCLGAFVDSLRLLPSWSRTLMVIVPDHYGAWPQGLEQPEERHAVPLVLAGGALRPHAEVDSLPASQTDIAATLLGALGLSHDEFEFSNDLRRPGARRQAFLADPSLVALVRDSVTVAWNCDASQPVAVASATPASAHDLDLLKAYLQILFLRISQL